MVKCSSAMTNRDIRSLPLKMADAIKADLTAALAAQGDTPPLLLEAANRLQKALDQKRCEIITEEDADLANLETDVPETTKPRR